MASHRAALSGNVSLIDTFSSGYDRLQKLTVATFLADSGSSVGAN